MIKIKRIYEKASGSDGTRILVDRLWPRGVSKEEAALDDWMKEIAPSTELRVWFNHDPLKFDTFTARYRAELQDNPALAKFVALAKEGDNTTLLYAAKDPKVNHAVVLLNTLEGRRPK